MLAISIIISTRNRAGDLKEAVQSLITQDCSAKIFDIIVVDNASTDETRQVIDHFQKTTDYPRIHEVLEPLLGLSRARNAGARVAEGEILAYMDDDAIADSSWVGQILDAYRRHPEASAIGGRTKILWPNARPLWLPKSLECFYAAFDLGDEEQELHWPRYCYGTHMTFRKKTFNCLGGFKGELGRVGKNLMSNEEMEFAQRLHEAGGITWYTPRAIIFHKAKPDRVSPGWVARRSYWQGISDVAFERLSQPDLGRFALLKRVYRHLRELKPDLLPLIRWVLGVKNGRTLMDECRIMSRLGALCQSTIELVRLDLRKRI